MKKITAITSIGAGLEYYDFVIYAQLATYISNTFFPPATTHTALIKTFAVFAVGYFARPLGGLLFGLVGDRFGRKNTFLISILLMALATLGMGVLPGYSHWGNLASLALLMLRILQGISFGAEFPGAITFLSEHASSQNRGLHVGFMAASLGLGSALGSGLILLLNYALTPAQMATWGWRIPFILGSLLAIIGYVLRRKTQETPLFLQQSLKQAKLSNAEILINLFSKHWLQLFQGLGISLFTGCLIIFGISLPAYLNAHFNYSLTEVYQANTIGLIWCTLILPFCGWVSDKIGRIRQLATICLAFALLSFWLFKMLYWHHYPALLGFVLIYETVIAATAACYLPLSAGLFPTSIRYTGIALYYNIGSALAGLTPFLLNWLMAITGQAVFVSLLFSGLALLAAITALSLRRQSINL